MSRKAYIFWAIAFAALTCFWPMIVKALFYGFIEWEFAKYNNNAAARFSLVSAWLLWAMISAIMGVCAVNKEDKR